MAKHEANPGIKKIGIISIHYGINFGSALQCYALYEYVSRHIEGAQVEVINYLPERFRWRNRLAYRGKIGIKPLLQHALRVFRSVYNNRKFDRYLRSVVNLSPVIHTMDEAGRRYADYDYLIAGSDQIWNSDYNQGIDPMYYLCFAKEKARKIAYAASCGKTVFTEEEWDRVHEYLEGFRGISLRESSAVPMFEAHGIAGCEFVLDPTYLLSKREWAAIETEVKGCPADYLLVYYLDVDGRDIIQMAGRIAKKRGLKLVLIQNGRRKKRTDVDYVVYNATPDRYIWLFRNAAFVVTNSFHGVSFSINLERQFVALRREKYNSRLDSILQAMDLTDRYVTCDFDGEIARCIDYGKVNQKKEALLNRSTMFLRRGLEK